MSLRIAFFLLPFLSPSIRSAVAAEPVSLSDIAENIRVADGEVTIRASRPAEGGSEAWVEKTLTRKEALEMVYRQMAAREYERAAGSKELSEEARARAAESLKAMGDMAEAALKDAKAVTVDPKDLENSSRYCAWGYCFDYGRRFSVRTPTAVAGVRGGRTIPDPLQEELARLGEGAETAGRSLETGDVYLKMAAASTSAEAASLENAGRYCAWGYCVNIPEPRPVRTPTAVAAVRGGRTLPPAAKSDPQEIYKRSSPSVVVVLCRNPDGGELGTGSVIDADGRILTNAHVVIPDSTGKPFETIRIYFKPDALTGDPKRDLTNPVAARVVKADRSLDLALLELIEPRAGTPVMPVAEDSDTQPGEAVITIGHPEQGGLWTLTSGVVSALVADLGGVKGKDAYQTDASINRGNSGGPLLDLSGRLIGVNTSMARRAADGLAITSVNFAVRASVVSKWLASAGTGITGTLAAANNAPEPVVSGKTVPLGKPEILTPAKPFKSTELIDSFRESMAETKERMRDGIEEMRRRQKEEMRSFKKAN